MGRPAKSLPEFVRDGTFRGRREWHRELLAGPDLPWPGLALLQHQYRAARSEPERRAAALAFEQAVLLIHETTGLEQAGGGARALAAELAALGRPGSTKQLLAFFPTLLVHTVGPLRGEPFQLEPWQKQFLRELNRRDNQGRRVYRLGLLSLPRGCGKTILAAGVALFELVSRTDAPEILIAAGSKEQAGICFRFCLAMAEQGPLADWVKLKGGRLVCPATGGSIRVVSSQGSLQHGLAPSLVILDELWNFTTKAQEELYTAASSSLHKRPEAYLLVTTTAGTSQHSLLGRIYQDAQTWPEVTSSRHGCLTVCKDEQNGSLLHWYGAPAGCRLDDRDLWRAANPARWVTIRDLARHRHDPGLGEASFRRLHLNMWVDARTVWIAAELWQSLACDEKIPKGAPLYIGVDVGIHHDTTAVSWAYRLPNGRIIVRSCVFSARDTVPHNVHCDGGSVDLEAVETFILDRLAGHFKVREVAYDPRYFHRSAEHLAKQGLTMVEFLAGSAPMYDAYQTFYQRAKEGTLTHNGDKVLAAHLDATAAIPRERGWKLHKRNKNQPIDAVIAAVIAVSRADRGREPPKPQIHWVDLGRL